MFTIIVAKDNRGGIGFEGKIPWKCKGDMAHFKNVTTNNVVIMGRKTYESIGKPLPNRVNIVISNTMQSTDNLIVLNSVPECIEYCARNFKNKKKFVIGGSKIYEEFYSCDAVSDEYITFIDSVFKCDTFFNAHQGSEHYRSETLDTFQLDGTNITASLIYITYKNVEELDFLELGSSILRNGTVRDDRTGTGTISLFGNQLKFNLSNNNFPLLTTRKMFFRGIFEELMLYIRGQTDSSILEEKKIDIWTGNTSRAFLDDKGLERLPVGDMGASYGFLFRHFGAKYIDCKTSYVGQGIDQLTSVINTIKTKPTDRRIVISLWDPTNLKNCPLPPCLYNYQFYVVSGVLDCMMTQRSSDYAVAGGWNVATGSLLTILIASVCGLSPGTLTWNIGDTHVYNNLVDKFKMQCEREPHAFPKLFINKKENITDYEYTDLVLADYTYHPAIDYPMSV
jgi:dihydrofolate reductase/thymidylate synthase